MSQSEEEKPQRTLVGSGHPGKTPPGPDSRGHYLVVIEGLEPGKIVEIGADPVTIGRDPKQALVLADTEMSRLHARVSLTEGKVTAEDLGSTNGTFVDGQRISTPVALREGSVIQVGQQFLKYERRDRREVEKSQELSRELLQASNYVRSLLPAPIETPPVRVSWSFLPSTQLGGDAFGYQWLDPDTFIFYLVDVSGHGVGPGMHSATVMNVLRQRALPDVDFANPGQVLSSLNNRFQMDEHDDMFFTMWYGVYRTGSRTLVYSVAGHHPAYLVGADRKRADPLGSPNLMIGAMPDVAYSGQEAQVETGSTLYVFSDGVFEIVTKEDEQWDISDFLPHLLDPPEDQIPEPERLYRLVRGVARPGLLDDDFSLMALTFD